MDIAVTTLQASDTAAAEQAYAIVAAAVTADVPDFPPTSRQRFLGGLAEPRPGDRPRRLLAHLDGVPAGYADVSLPQLENTDHAAVDLRVHPEHRRRGVGRALHERVLRVIREDGRKRLIGQVVAPLPGGPARSVDGERFAAAVGARAALANTRRRLDLDQRDDAGLDRLLAAARARAAGYSLVSWSGAAPAEYVADVARLDGRLLADAPLGDLVLEPEKVDADRIRERERVHLVRGQRTHHCAIRHDATGRLVGWTWLDVQGDLGWHAFQQLTLVDPEHRGHRLGLLIKIENLRYALTREPELRVIDTWNAAANQHMISINEAMGFRPVDAWTDWQLSL